MAWSCLACTFDNENNSSNQCNVCCTRRPGSFTEAVKTQQALSQRTLFGELAIVKKADTSTSKENKKRPRPEDPIATNDTVAFNTVSLDPFPVLWDRAQSNLQSIFRIPSLRHLQPIAIQNALQRNSQIIIMATGGGKSLCYQLPATVFGGVTLVVSPLIALMQDQVQALQAKGVSAEVISSANGERINATILQRLRTDQTKPIHLLYVTPELLQTQRFQIILAELYTKKRLAMVAIDEAHCLSTWGHDFRTAYRKLDCFQRDFPSLPIMACTATATSKVIQDIQTLLFAHPVPCHTSTFNRANISYHVRFKDSLDNMTSTGAMGDLILFLQQQHKAVTLCSGIIYCHRRQDTESLAHQITTRTGIAAAAYHAGVKDRCNIQKSWTEGIIPIAVATVAFGMGVDLGHVRYVVHWSLPKTLEGFYQESGRGGRDLQPATSILYYSKEDASRFSYIIHKSMTPKNKQTSEKALEALEIMVNYCVQPSCRRQFLLKHFGENIDPDKVCQKTCDYCKDPKKVARDIQASQVVKDVMSYKRGPIANKGSEWDGQWEGPHEGEDDDEDELWGDPDWGMSETPNEDILDKKMSSNKQSLRSILNKYEALDCQEHKKDGFVTFKIKQEVKSANVLIPDHLRQNVPDPFQHLSCTKSKQIKSSIELGSERSQLEADLAKIKAEQQAKLAALKARERRPAPPPPPPMLSFASKKR